MNLAFSNLLNRHGLGRIASDVDEELQFHIEMLERKFMQHGMTSAHAKAAALQRFGSPDRIRKQCVEIRRRSRPLKRTLKSFSILLAFTGLAIHIHSSDCFITFGITLIWWGAGNNLGTILTHRLYCLAIAGAYLALSHIFFARKFTKTLRLMADSVACVGPS
jgi:hypothetical protein